VQAFAQLRSGAQAEADATLVIAGAQGWGYEDVRQEVDRLNIGDRVVFTGRIDDADLPALYRSATVFVYPALYEGFGLPPLEAMACGVPVIASSASSLPEVVGEAGLLVDPVDVGAISAALNRVLGDESLRASMRQAGIAQARGFTWARAAQQTWDLYEKMIGR
jgi:glycosyltransferase involved in cell wall biosynthesis